LRPTAGSTVTASINTRPQKVFEARNPRQRTHRKNPRADYRISGRGLFLASKTGLILESASALMRLRPPTAPDTFFAVPAMLPPPPGLCPYASNPAAIAGSRLATVAAPRIPRGRSLQQQPRKNHCLRHCVRSCAKIPRPRHQAFNSSSPNP